MHVIQPEFGEANVLLWVLANILPQARGGDQPACHHQPDILGWMIKDLPCREALCLELHQHGQLGVFVDICGLAVQIAVPLSTYLCVSLLCV